MTLSELRRDALQAGLAVMAAPGPSAGVSAAYEAALAALPAEARHEVADMIAAVVEATHARAPRCPSCGATL